MKQKLTLLLTLLAFGLTNAWAIDTKVADYSSVQPWADSGTQNITRSSDKLTLTTTDASGLAGLTLTTNGSSSAGYWDRSGNWLLIIPGSTDEVTYTVTITAPTEYTIVGYNMECCSWNANRTYVVTAADGTTVTTTSTTTQTLNVTKLDATSTTFTVKGEGTSTSSVYFTIKNMTVALVKKQGTQLNSTADGVTWSSGSSSWNNSWSSGTTPAVTLNANWSSGSTMNEFKAATNVAGGFYLHSVNTPVYTISVPFNYLIKSYTIVGTANAAVTLSPTEGTTDNTTFAASITKAATVTVTPTNSVKFTLSGSSAYIDDATIFVEYVTTSSQTITDLSSLSNNKAYVISNARATWQFADDAAAMTASSSTTNLGSAAQQIAIIQKDNKYYLYSVNARKYLTANNTLTSIPTDAEQVTIAATGNDSYPWYFQFTDNTSGFINIGSSTNVVIDGWGPGGSNPYGSLDDGNRNVIIEAADFDPTTLPFEVTYTLKYADVTVGTATVGAYEGDTPSLPSSLDNGLCDYTYSVETLSSSTSAVTVTATWSESAPFQLSDAPTDEAHWYYLTLNNTLVPTYNSDATINVESSSSTRTLGNYNQEWAFVGNPYTGLSIYNRAAGGTMKLGTSVNPASDGNTGGSTRAVLLASPAYNDWIPQSSPYATGGFYLFLKIDNNTKYGANNRDSQMAFWTGGYGTGSTFTVEEVVDDYTAQVEAEIQPFITSADDNMLFGISSDAATDLTAAISLAKSAENGGEEEITLSEYNQLKQALQGSIKYPTTGYYRIKSSGNRIGESYIGYGQPSSANAGLITVTAANATSDASTIIKFTGSNGTYKLSTQGLNIQSQTSSDCAFPATTAEGADFKFNILRPGVVSIHNDASYLNASFNGDLHEAGWNVPGVVNWNANAGASEWTVEEVTDIAVTLNGVGESYYATFCVPFDVTFSGATAYTLAKDGTNLEMTAVSTVAAGTPVVLVGASNSATATIGTNYSATPVAGNALTGNYLPISGFAGTTHYTLGTDGTKVGFFHWTGTTLKANRAYVAGDEGSDVKGFYLDLEDDATSINEVLRVKNEEMEGAPVFNLAGQRIQKMQKGINIVGGKKIVVK